MSLPDFSSCVYVAVERQPGGQSKPTVSKLTQMYNIIEITSMCLRSCLGQMEDFTCDIYCLSSDGVFFRVVGFTVENIYGHLVPIQSGVLEAVKNSAYLPDSVEADLNGACI